MTSDYVPIQPLCELNAHQTHRAMIALVELLGSLGPFDQFRCTLVYTGGAGWDRAHVSVERGGEVIRSYFDVAGVLTTDPVSAFLTAQNQFALTWHQPSLFPAA